MGDSDVTATEFLRLEERIRQEQETFNLRKEHEERWFNLRLRMGYMAVLVLPFILLVCSTIIYNHESLPPSVVTLASSALLVDVLGLLISVWKLILNPSSINKTEPIIRGFERVKDEE